MVTVGQVLLLCHELTGGSVCILEPVTSLAGQPTGPELQLLETAMRHGRIPALLQRAAGGAMLAAAAADRTI